MTSEQKQQIKEKILHDIETLTNEIQNIQEKDVKIEQDCSLDDINRKDMMLDKELNTKVVHQAQKRLKQLQITLLRVEEEEYGVCVECEEDILFARLMLLPESRYCVDCKTELNLPHSE